MSERKKRRLYKDNPSKTLNEDDTVKTFQQKIKELNKFVHDALNRVKINEISEMTMRGPDLSTVGDKFAQTNMDAWKNGTHIADIEQYEVKKNSGPLPNSDHYSLWDGDILVAFATLTHDDVVDGVWVNEKYRGQKLFSMMLWFFKTRLNRSPLMIGDIHSRDMQEVVKGLSRFEKKWYNIRTHEVEPFSLDTLDNYYSFLKPTPWRLMLENDGEFNWPMFRTGAQFMKEAYDPYIQYDEEIERSLGRLT